MEEKYLQKLEFDKIRAALASLCTTNDARLQAQNLLPYKKLFDVREALAETDEAVEILMRKERPPFSDIGDVSVSLKRAAVSAELSTKELIAVSRYIDTLDRLKQFALKGDSPLSAESFPKLYPYFEALNPPVFLRTEIDRCILGEDEISDNASPKLSAIRRSIHQQEEKIRQDLQKMIHSEKLRGVLQDSVITLRNGRYCLPVKAENRGSFSGLIHDQSGSGSTLFMEPMSVVETNNKIKTLQAEEETEIHEILIRLSSSVSVNATELNADYSLLVHLDFVFARGRLALQQNAMCPEMSERGEINLPKARHPLLSKDIVVPISIRLGRSEGTSGGEYFTTLVITGPNTGGKTISLKTVGLLSVMAQSGLFIPTATGAKTRMFDNVFADIGDEQSIEQSLSTFSSHMVNIVHILKNVTVDSLVLFDELGAGTDPIEGAALAQSILQTLTKSEIYTIATTHYSELKMYALSTDGVENAACEFDVETLKPTYRLLIGVPGKSNAFAIGRRLGLDEYLLEDAEKLLEASDVRFEDLMTDFEIKSRKLEEDSEKLDALKRELDRLTAEQKSLSAKLESQKEKILAKAQAEARAMLADAKAEVDATLARVNKLIQSGKAVDVRALEQERSNLRDKLSKLDTEDETVHSGKKDKNTHDKLIATLRVGQKVYIEGYDIPYTVLSLPDAKGNLTAQAGILKMKVHQSELLASAEDEEPLAQKTKTPKKASEGGSGGTSGTVHMELDLRGMTADEALYQMDKYLDEACLSSLDQVRIIHGKGSGALRTAVHNALKRDPHVKSFRLGEYGEGDAGITVVTLKK